MGLVDEMFDADDRAAVEAALAKGAEIEELITRTEAAGIDVTAQKAGINKRTEQLRAIKSAFFPSG